MSRFSPTQIALGVLTLFGCVFPALTTEAAVPRGVFSLSIAGVKAKEIALNNLDVTGISVRQDWAELEPEEGEFDFEFLNSEVARAQAVGKQVFLRINTQAGKPAWVTQAVEDAGGTFFTFEDDGGTTIPVFWDPTYLAKKKAMLTALGAQFSNNPAVTIVAVSFANAKSEDWNVPHMEKEVLEWIRLGYTSDKMLDAARQIIDTAMLAFPNQYLALAVGGNGHSEDRANLDESATYVASHAVANARATWPGRLIVQINSLSTFNPSAPGNDDSAWNLLWNSRPEVGAQMLYKVFEDDDYRVNDGMDGDFAEILTNAVDHGLGYDENGLSYELNYIEIYQEDVENLPAVITYARSRWNLRPRRFQPQPQLQLQLQPQPQHQHQHQLRLRLRLRLRLQHRPQPQYQHRPQVRLQLQHRPQPPTPPRRQLKRQPRPRRRHPHPPTLRFQRRRQSLRRWSWEICRLVWSWGRVTKPSLAALSSRAHSRKR